ncbi:hypothetical protein [Penaeicola halotolerans]|uniref:hypothetical protein n=1 Tax=Penaeicola halotolerans TaxID=2793196 RepID=UPI001CF81AFA|nr:hypothetical protein [Penaeicola halotolerans]
MRKFLKSLVIACSLLLVQISASAQCAMCRVSVENNVSAGDTSVASGLNFGILYLFVMPYLMAMVIGFFWYRSSKKNKLKAMRFIKR